MGVYPIRSRKGSCLSVDIKSGACNSLYLIYFLPNLYMNLFTVE